MEPVQVDPAAIIPILQQRLSEAMTQGAAWEAAYRVLQAEHDKQHDILNTEILRLREKLEST